MLLFIFRSSAFRTQRGPLPWCVDVRAVISVVEDLNVDKEVLLGSDGVKKWTQLLPAHLPVRRLSRHENRN